MRTRLLDLLTAARALVVLLAAAMLWIARPPLPQLPGSLMASVTTSEVEQVVGWVAWLLAVFLALAALERIAGNARAARRNRATADLARVLPGAPSARTACPSRTPRTSFVLTIPPRSNADAPTADEQAAVPHPATPNAIAEPGISIAVLGPLSIEGAAARIRRKATRELLAFLAFHPRGASRDQLVEALWPGLDPERARARFWQSVTEARKALGEAWVQDGDRYKLDRSRVRVDLDELNRLLAAEPQPATLETALALWRGEPLDGADYFWADGEIRSLHATLVDLLESVGRARLDGDDARGALQLAEQAITLDGLNEASWRLALEAEYALGLRESITRRYEELSRSLDEQLGLKPASETRLIYRQLLGPA